MTDLLASLAAPIAGAAAALADGATPEVELERPSDPAHGDFATNVALRLAPGPQAAAAADRRGDREPDPDADDFAAVEVAGPGFVNLRLAAGWYRAALAVDPRARADATAPARRSAPRSSSSSSSRPTRPASLTVGSARNGAYGDAVARLLEFAGHEVLREYYFNDAGQQMDRFGASVRARKRGEPVPEDGYPGDGARGARGGARHRPDAPVEAFTAAAVPPMFDAHQGDARTAAHRRRHLLLRA